MNFRSFLEHEEALCVKFEVRTCAVAVLFCTNCDVELEVVVGVVQGLGVSCGVGQVLTLTVGVVAELGPVSFVRHLRPP